MTKARKRKGGGGGNDAGTSGGATTTWDSAHHALRQEHQANKRLKKQQRREEQQEQEGMDDTASASKSRKQEAKDERRHQRTAKLTRDSREKRQDAKLRLNITKTQREIEALREKLRQWDNVAEQQRLDEEERKRTAPPKKKGRLGPETWKLKGAARPAWLVNEFDVRYVCPHQKAHDEAREKARRVQNLLVLYKGRFGQPNDNVNNDKKKNKDLSYPYRRQFLALLMQFGLLNKEAKKYKTARVAFLECLDLDGVEHPITDARCHLMRLYLHVNRPQSVHELWKTRFQNQAATNQEKSVWVLYSVALVEYIRWKDFGEASQKDAEVALARAFRGNPLCAYHLAFSEFFHESMEYADDIEDASEEHMLEQAIEYCHGEQMGMWMGTDGALEWVQDTLLRILQGQQQQQLNGISKDDLDWNRQLQMIEGAAKREKEQRSGNDAEDDVEDPQSKEEEETVDVLMFAGMYRTTMEMLEGNGSLARVPRPILVAQQVEHDQASDDEDGGENSDDSN